MAKIYYNTQTTATVEMEVSKYEKLPQQIKRNYREAAPSEVELHEKRVGKSAVTIARRKAAEKQAEKDAKAKADAKAKDASKEKGAPATPNADSSEK